MMDRLKKLCSLFGTSGNEEGIREYILSEISPYAECKVDALGNIIAFKKGKNRSAARLMVDAHMDEVGIIITSITPDGFLKFATVGGIKECILLSRTVTIDGKIKGVIGCKPVHLSSADERKKAPKKDALYIDIGAASKEEAEEHISIGDYGIIDGDFELLSPDKIKAKALDDRVGCALLIDLLRCEADYDFYATFTVQEEIGTRGAKTAAYTVNPEYALVIEATTAADIDGVADSDAVCRLGQGPSVSFMDCGTVYDRALYNAALASGIKCQPKAAVAGGNNSSAIHLSRAGVRTLAISLPCRYIHSPSCVAERGDIDGMLELTKYMINKICSGELK